MSINCLFGKGFSVIKTAQIGKTINFKNLRYAPELADRIEINFKKLSKEELVHWEDTVNKTCGNYFAGLSSTKNLNAAEKIDLINLLHSAKDIEPFLLMSTGGRSAMATSMHPILNKLNTANFSIVPDALSQFKNVFIFNRKSMLENIEKNKSFYTKRLNLPPDLSNDKIYDRLVSKAYSPLIVSKRKDCQDIIGVMFGYPFKDSIIFQLERDTGLGSDLRKDIPRFKMELKKILNSDNSRYKDFGNDFKQDIEKSIDSIETINVSNQVGYPQGYTFVEYTKQPDEVSRIGKQIRSSTAELKRLNKMEEELQLAREQEELKKLKIEQERKFSQALDNLENMSGPQQPCIDFLRDLMDKHGNTGM